MNFNFFSRTESVLCLLLCTVATVAQNKCTTFGQVNDLHNACMDYVIGSEVFRDANITHRLTLMCSPRHAYESCMTRRTAGCSEKQDIEDEVEHSLSACSTTKGKDQWAETYLVPYISYQSCRGKRSDMPKCFEELAKTGQEFPFLDESFKQGLDKLQSFKRKYLSCILEWFQASDDCTDNWRQSYLSQIIQFMQTRRYFGIYLDTQDIGDFEDLQAEIDAHHATV